MLDRTHRRVRRLVGSTAAVLVAAGLVAAAPAAWSADLNPWLDPTFGSAGTVDLPAGSLTTVDSVGRVLALTRSDDPVPVVALRRFTPAGQPDSSFGAGGTVTLATRPDGMLAGSDGSVTTVRTLGDPAQFELRRWTVAGVPDPVFGVDGQVTVDLGTPVDRFAVGLAGRADGDVVLSAIHQVFPGTTSTLAAIAPTGALDPTWAPGAARPGVLTVPGLINGVATDGNAVVVVGFPDPSNAVPTLTRYTAAGVRDPAFGSGGSVVLPVGLNVQAVDAVPGGPYYASGDQLGHGMSVSRVLATGVVDAGFGTAGLASGPGGDCAPSGRLTVVAPTGIYLIGRHTDCGGSPLLVDRFTAAGAPDPTFGTAGEVTIDGIGDELSLAGTGLGLQPGGQPLAYVETAPEDGSSPPVGHIVRLLTALAGPAAPGVDRVVSADATAGTGKLTTPTLTTSGPHEVLIAFVSADGNASPKQKVTKVAGAGVTWTLVVRTNDNFGTAEIWQASATTAVSGAITATLGQASFHGSITVAAFTGAAPATISATATGNTNQPQVSLVTNHAGSVVWGVGHDWSAAANRTPAAGQVLVHEFVDGSIGDTFWVQSVVGATTGPGAVLLSTSAPAKDRWQYSAVEIPAA